MEGGSDLGDRAAGIWSTYTTNTSRIIELLGTILSSVLCVL